MSINKPRALPLGWTILMGLDGTKMLQQLLAEQEAVKIWCNGQNFKNLSFLKIVSICAVPRNGRVACTKPWGMDLYSAYEPGKEKCKKAHLLQAAAEVLLRGGSPSTPPGHTPLPQASTLPHPEMAPLSLPCPSYFSWLALSNHFLFFNAHKNLFVDYAQVRALYQVLQKAQEGSLLNHEWLGINQRFKLTNTCEWSYCHEEEGKGHHKGTSTVGTPKAGETAFCQESFME